MRITREKLIELARREAERRAATGDVIAGYVIGSVAWGEPLFGGGADIDLVLIHEARPPLRREVVVLSQQVHLDILHHSRNLYRRPRRLRTHPWLGPAMCEPTFLHDPTHFFEWAQAAARGQFHRPDHTYARAQAFLGRARQRVERLRDEPFWIEGYLTAALEGANAVTTLSGFPASGRRVAFAMARRLAALGHPQVFRGFMALLGAEGVSNWDVPAWLSAWGRAFDALAQDGRDPALHPARRNYYLGAFQSMAEADQPEALLWPLLITWTWAIRSLEETGRAAPHHPAWKGALEGLGLGAADRERQSAALEAYLDDVEGVLEGWAQENGAWQRPGRLE